VCSGDLRRCGVRLLSLVRLRGCIRGSGRRVGLARRQEIVHQHVKCCEQAVKVGVHEATSVVDVALATPTFDSRPISPRAATTPRANSESVV
jgi:hypothetical protein